MEKRVGCNVIRVLFIPSTISTFLWNFFPDECDFVSKSKVFRRWIGWYFSHVILNFNFLCSFLAIYLFLLIHRQKIRKNARNKLAK